MATERSEVKDEEQHLDERILVHGHPFVVHSFHIARANEDTRLSFDNDVAIIEMFDNELCPTEGFNELNLRCKQFS